MTELGLEALGTARRDVRDALEFHESSILAFRPGKLSWFALDTTEAASNADAEDAGKPPHLTTTASCYESLANRDPANDCLGGTEYGKAADTFARRALEAPGSAWKSDGAADVYCRVRTLPAILRFAQGDLGAELAEAASKRLVEAWSTVDAMRPAEAGLGEREVRSRRKTSEAATSDYPPNAFHTYWGVRALHAYRGRQERDLTLPDLSSKLEKLESLARSWIGDALARHTALLLGGGTHGDAQQLAYALACDLMLASKAPLTAGSERHDLYAAALGAFFGAQQQSGSWPRSEPLFHYPNSGNAYCYPYETLAELLRPALPREAGRVFRMLLKQHLPALLRAWKYADNTKVPLSREHTDAYGWSSTHHAGRLLPEAWATASVYSYAQMLRCLLGHFASEAAHGELRARRPDYRGVDDARKQLAERGDTFATGDWTVGRRLASLFVHPRSAPDVDAEIVNPDAALIDESDARSAILFGPPGTGKTTLAEALAGALGWQFVEVLASDFLVRGVDAVPAEADRIFAALMELDRCVVLFDEIDELIRERDSSETDPFGRFLTTSMLPKIARLWKQRRIIFFVATNHVAIADPAVRRASRFDATILVAPPSLHVKRRRLSEMLGDDAPEFDDAAVHAALEGIRDAETKALPFGVLALLRYDQISELARRLRDDRTEDRLTKALRALGEDLQRNEWRPPPKLKNNHESEESEQADPLVALFRVYREYRNAERLDGSRRGLFACDSEIRLSSGFQSAGDSADGLSLYVAPPDLASIAQPDGKATGEIYLLAEGEHNATVGDGCLLRFVPR